MAVEKVAYQVILKEGSFELRRYEPMLVVTSRNSDLSGGNGFNQLFNYISGNNQDSKKISMTAPVIDSLEGQLSTTSFVMPKEFGFHDIPLPNGPYLKPREIKARQVAVIRFSGTINAHVIKDKKTELEEWLKQKEIAPIGTMELARYNAPFVPPFARRNELIIEVETVI